MILSARNAPQTGRNLFFLHFKRFLAAHSNKINKVLVGQAGGFIVKFNKEGADAV